METENKNLLTEGAKAYGIFLDEKAIEAFELYLRELVKWNQKINLTAIRTEKGIVLKHFLDSLSVLPHLSGVSLLLDLGSGAGFPGIPLKIVQPSLRVTLVDSVRKKVDFQRHILRTLGLRGIEAVHGRAQDQEILGRMKSQFDMVVSRALSDTQTFLKLSAPFLKKGGRVLAMKADVSREEIQRQTEAEGDRYELLETVSLILPFSSFKRSILMFEKR